MNINVLRQLSYGVYIVSSLDGNRPVGCVANSTMQITSEPATIAVSVNHKNYTNKCIRNSKKFSVSIMSEQANKETIGVFGFQSSENVDKFTNTSYSMKSGVPVINDSCGFLVCEVVNTMETDTHTIFLGKVIDGDELKSEKPMTYAYYHEVFKMKSPKTAPTYIEEAPKEEAKQTSQQTDDNKPKDKYVCSICGYVYEGDVPFNDLPDDYLCPLCYQPKSVFHLIEG